MSRRSLTALRAMRQRNASLAETVKIIWFIYLIAGFPLATYLEPVLHANTPAHLVEYSPSLAGMPLAITFFFAGLVPLTFLWWGLSWFGIPRVDLREWFIVTTQAEILSGLLLSAGWLSGHAGDNVWRWVFLIGLQATYAAVAAFLVHWLDSGEASSAFRTSYPVRHWLILILCPLLVVPVVILSALVSFMTGPYIVLGLVGLFFLKTLQTAFFAKDAPIRRSYRPTRNIRDFL